jgi:hypothetical protein
LSIQATVTEDEGMKHTFSSEKPQAHQASFGGIVCPNLLCIYIEVDEKQKAL